MITAAADGSALNNPGPAGWAWYVDDTCWAAGGWPKATNNRGELQAVLDLLQQTAPTDEEVHILCDSQYVINVITKWMAGWKRKGWKKADGKPVLNVDLVQALDQAMAGRRVTFEWVKGHSGHDLNEAADQRARAAATAFRDGTSVDSGPGFTSDRAEPTDAFTAEVNELLTEAEEEPELGVPEPATEGFVGQPGFAGDLFSGIDDSDLPEPTAVEYVLAAERSLLTDEVRQDPAQVAALLHPEWYEIGSSGRRWTRAEMLAEIGPLRQSDPDVEDVFADVAADEIDRHTILLVWRSNTAWRCSLWVRHGGSWVQRYHQGTPLEAS